jgi:hypothetical protein
MVQQLVRDLGLLKGKVKIYTPEARESEADENELIS